MKRREMLGIVPAGIAGLTALASKVTAQERGIDSGDKPEKDNSQPFEMTYIRNVLRMLKKVRETQADKILESAYSIARAVEEGKSVWCCWDLGHSSLADLFPGRCGKPDFLIPGYNSNLVKDGDVVMTNFPWPEGHIEDMAKHDLFVIGGPCPWGGDVPGAENIQEDIRKLKIRPLADIWIDNYSDYLGAQVKIPGSEAPLGPESGPLCGSILWMMVADACRILGRKGKTVNVSGNEPPFTGNRIPWVNLDRPLLDVYYDEVSRQLNTIESELGKIKIIADMAADTLIKGGNVYFYSRYPDCLASEATGRRGGFAFARNLDDSNLKGPTSKDCVIMGTYEPNDEADLKNLDTLKKLKVRIASIGPITRDTKIQEGRAIFKETEAHAGIVADTYGLFAIPGFNRKVCPTSGVVDTSVLWTMSTALAMEIIKRTGNTPAINFNGALIWGSSHNARMRALADTRGY